MTGDPSCVHRTMTNDFVVDKGKTKRIGYCKVQQKRLTWRYNCSSSCKDYESKNGNADQQTLTEGCGPL